MRLSVVRLIAAREIRDLLRDRRSVVMVFVLPIVLYPFLGVASLYMLKLTAEQEVRVGIVGEEHLPATPPLVQDGRFVDDAAAPAPDDIEPPLGQMRVTPIAGDPATALAGKAVDVLLRVPAGFAAAVRDNAKPQLTMEHRDGDDKSKTAARRLRGVVGRWRAKLLRQRFERANLPADFDSVFELADPLAARWKKKQAADEVRDGLSRMLPFILMMWLVAGAIQPAVDLTAGEKERGTMETLLISPADRGEIVFGKFLAVTAYSFSSVLWNVVWLTVACSVGEAVFDERMVNKAGLFGCVVLALPMAMLFSAVCLSLGVFARSTKEGQYYLVPLIVVVMPLAFWSMMPGKELDAGSALIPVTGAMMLQQKLLAVSTEPVPWAMFAPVLGGLTVCVAAALYSAVRQFRREEVLFREVGGDKGGRLSRLFRS